MVYKVIGLMSGSSLDGLDICYAELDENRGNWTAEIIHADCVPYSADWTAKLKGALNLSVPDFLKLHTEYGRYLGETVHTFMEDKELHLKVHFIASHGHTVFHEPQSHTTFQLGDGASIAAVLGIPVISDLRTADIALGGQGAPIVPIGDKLLFGDYDALVNIGGICNASIKKEDGNYTAFDISVANQALNFLAAKAGKDFDENGAIAATGKLIEQEMLQLGGENYYPKPAPKSLSNEKAMALVSNFINNEEYSVEDRLHTMTHFIAAQITAAIVLNIGEDTEGKKILITGGGALNRYLIDSLKKLFAHHKMELVLPSEQIVLYKEALVMALIGTLRWREETNILASATGASRNSISGAYWMGA